ncbi:BMP family ABC transporter substrate-binding protein [uncultured Ferrovibrio sp.]|jgi:basic membrane protein A|uniref:BMP family lipoprotein n=1 Tax=uncultured Ferrovibrio sp. TaxID=1576913 RepID=UPI0026123B65|nr:BMP family ABC transporter substrate-binding protein [uncultured Ferrovibrio sp.]
MTKIIRTTLGAAAIALMAASAQAADIKPAVVYDMGGKFDKSFNEAAYIGAEKFKAESKIGYADFEVNNETQFEQAHRRFAQRGQDPIIGVGFSQANAVEKVAKEFPNIRFTVIDSVVKLDNVQSVLFKEHEGSFLVGVAAAMASKSGKVGFIGGMDIPLIRRFQCGYEQGVKYANPNAEVLANMTGTTPTAWNDPGRGSELAKGQFDRGVDVVFAAAGGTGVGVYQAAKDRGKLAIGVDSNQNHLHPGTMLTSMVKRVDLATYNSFKAAQDGSWKPGVTVLGLKEGGVDWALDEHNAKLVSTEMKAKIEQAKADIITGKIVVHDYMSNNACK